MPKPVSGPEDVLPPHLNRHPIYKDFLFRDGFSPYPVTDPDASLKVCLANFGHYEYGILAVSTIIPAYFGYSGNSKNINFETLTLAFKKGAFVVFHFCSGCLRDCWPVFVTLMLTLIVIMIGWNFLL